MDKERVKALASNVNSLIENYQSQQQNTAKLFEICLEFLEDKGHGVYVGFAEAKAMAIKRKERKQELIAAIKGYIKMINEREKKDETVR